MEVRGVSQNYGRLRLLSDPVSGAATGPLTAVNFDSLLIGNCGDSVATRTGRKCDIFKDGRNQEAERDQQERQYRTGAGREMQTTRSKSESGLPVGKLQAKKAERQQGPE